MKKGLLIIVSELQTRARLFFLSDKLLAVLASQSCQRSRAKGFSQDLVTQSRTRSDKKNRRDDILLTKKGVRGP